MPSLLTLPLLNIVEALCLHCVPASRASYHTHALHMFDTREEREYSAALASLCLTSKALHEISTSRLYHHPATRKWWLLARTLLARDDLCRHIKHLCGCSWDTFDESKDPELYPTLLAIYKEEMEAHAQDNPGWEERDEGDDDEPFASELSAMVVMATLCPKLEKLDAKLGYNEDFFPAQPGSLRKLKHVEVGHSDTEMGMHLNAFWPLAEAAPKLAKLYCTSLASSGPPGFTFANVTELKLAHSGMDADSLHNVLQTFPRLEDFTFEAGGSTVCDEQFTPREAQNALRSAPGLLRLHLDFTEALLHETTDLDEYICSLQSLQHLQDLVLDTRCLIPHRDPFGTSYFRGPDGQMIRTDHAFDDESQLSEMLLVNLLPESIQSLLIWKGYNGPSADRLASSLAVLALAGPEKFPNLKHVGIYGPFESAQLQNLKDIFSEKDVGFDTAEFPPMMIGFDPEEV